MNTWPSYRCSQPGSPATGDPRFVTRKQLCLMRDRSISRWIKASIPINLCLILTTRSASKDRSWSNLSCSRRNDSQILHVRLTSQFPLKKDPVNISVHCKSIISTNGNSRIPNWHNCLRSVSGRTVHHLDPQSRPSQSLKIYSPNNPLSKLSAINMYLLPKSS